MIIFPVVGPCWYEEKWVCPDSADTRILTSAEKEFYNTVYKYGRGMGYAKGLDGFYAINCYWLVERTITLLGYHSYPDGTIYKKGSGLLLAHF